MKQPNPSLNMEQGRYFLECQRAYFRGLEIPEDKPKSTEVENKTGVSVPSTIVQDTRGDKSSNKV